ncbi:MAG: ABC transporter permease [Acidimicrobiia bacterium]|nr:ABC transporter permease [Acidimicrobiia bacterium]
MKLGLLELRRRPGQFGVAGGALAFLTLLLIFLGGLLDGLIGGSTGLLRAQSAELIVYSDDARASLVRSRLDPATIAAIGDVEGVSAVGGLGVAQVGARVLDADGQPRTDEVESVAVVGYELSATEVPDPPPVGEAYVDSSLGASVGDVVAIGPEQLEVEVVGAVDDTSYLLQPGVWVSPETYEQVLAAARPDLAMAPGVFQAALVRTADGVDPDVVAARVDDATGSTSTLTIDDAIAALPGVEDQEGTFGIVIGATFVVVGVVAALFFALITIERTGLYGVLKALGSSNLGVVASLVTQAVVVALVAFALGLGAILAASGVLAGAVPFDLSLERAVSTGVGLVIMSVVGSLLSARRVWRVDPASVIG